MTSRRVAVFLVISLILGACATPTSAGAPSASAPGSAAASSASPAAFAGGSGLARVRANGLKVGISNDKPWSYLDAKGQLTGAEGEMVKACAAQLGITDVYAVAAGSFSALLPGLVAKRWDIDAAGMNVTDARLQQAISTQKLYGFGSRALVQKGNPLKIHSWSDIKAAGVEIGIVAGSTTIAQAEGLGIKVKTYTNLENEFSDVIAGRLKVMVNAENELSVFIQQNPTAPVELAAPWDYQGVGFSNPGFYFNKDDVDLRNAFNDCLTKMKGDGSMAKILTQFGFDPATIQPVGPGLP